MLLEGERMNVKAYDVNAKGDVEWTALVGKQGRTLRDRVNAAREGSGCECEGL